MCKYFSIKFHDFGVWSIFVSLIDPVLIFVQFLFEKYNHLFGRSLRGVTVLQNMTLKNLVSQFFLLFLC